MRSIKPVTSMAKIEDLMVLLNLPKNYRWQIRNFLRFCEEKSIKPDALAFRQAADELYIQTKENRVAASTYNLYLSANRQLIMKLLQLRKATAVELFAANQIMKSRAIKISNSHDSSEVLTPDEIDLIKEYSTPRGRLIIELLQITALRISEALNLPKKMHMRGDHYQIDIVGKGGTARHVFIPVKLYRAICTEFSGKAFLFETRNRRKLDRNGVLKMMKEAARKAVEARRADTSLLHKAKLHGLRHAWATRALEKKIDLHTIAHHLGHQSIQTCVQFYIKKRPNAEEVMSVYKVSAA